ncbi:S8 family serine peptidase [Massilia sp. LXY-6]|uniref:S8 family serine peptidase n=1 Tax=Massilia sp. LXY-6 TaxID=3379823 RepID=UPI003EDEDA25
MKRLFAALLMLALACCVLPYGARARASDGDEQAARRVLVMLRMPPQHFRPDSSYGGGYADDGTGAARRRQASELADAHGLKVVDDWPMPAIGIDCFVMEEPGDAPLERVLDALAHDPRVAWAQPVHPYHGLEDGNAHGGDPLYPAQPAARLWHLAELHRVSTGRKVAVAVVDSGVDGAHPDLAGQLLLRQNFVDAMPDAAEAHGTAVAGIIAARAGNGLGIAGIAPQARLMALRACWEAARQETLCNSFTLGKALHFALLNGAQVINLSLGGPADRLLQTLIDTALARDVAVVAAVDPQRPDGGFPASLPGVIAVTQAGDRRALPAGAFQAPGIQVPAPLPGARWGLVSGSSYAAAHVAGLAALVLELRPGTTPPQLRRAFATAPRTTLVAHDPGRALEQAGSIDACATIARAAGACACQCPTTAAVTADPLP